MSPSSFQRPIPADVGVKPRVSNQWKRTVRGSGPWADLLRTRFQIAMRKHGLNRERLRVRTDLFHPPRGPQGELF